MIASCLVGLGVYLSMQITVKSSSNCLADFTTPSYLLVELFTPPRSSDGLQLPSGVRRFTPLSVSRMVSHDVSISITTSSVISDELLNRGDFTDKYNAFCGSQLQKHL
ncbi:hypothetical protein CCR75_001621 [Bremia lactucae]|uniref:Uncharacterized protein n=1 Tax=Bremia lactucae TaxID=4779 RepID=A0A976FPJ7_BRELC|nr:hypothetical protein CCR75_001621 [Bremia lactucae]